MTRSWGRWLRTWNTADKLLTSRMQQESTSSYLLGPGRNRRDSPKHPSRALPPEGIGTWELTLASICTFPSEITITVLHPDNVLWSPTAKSVLHRADYPLRGGNWAKHQWMVVPGWRLSSCPTGTVGGAAGKNAQQAIPSTCIYKWLLEFLTSLPLPFLLCFFKQTCSVLANSQV